MLGRVLTFVLFFGYSFLNAKNEGVAYTNSLCIYYLFRGYTRERSRKIVNRGLILTFKGKFGQKKQTKCCEITYSTGGITSAPHEF